MHVRCEVRCLLVLSSLSAANSNAIGGIITEHRPGAQFQELAQLGSPAPRAPDPGQPIEFNGFAGPEFGGTIWGTHAGQGEHGFGGTSVFADLNAPDFTVTVSSESIPPPAGKKFAGKITIDFSAFDPGAFSLHEVEILGIEDPSGDNFINTIEVIGAGVVLTNGYDIFWSGSGEALSSSEVVVIKWTQVPAPGSVCALGLGSLVLAHRRRRDH